MSKLEERERRRRSSVIGSMVREEAEDSRAKPGRPKEEREIKKRVSLSVLPSLYDDVRKIAYVQRRSISDIVGELLKGYRERHREELGEYEEIEGKR